MIVDIGDLLLHSENHHRHLELLDPVFRRLVQNGIKMNLEKCVFGSKKVFGFQLTKQGIKPGIDNLKAVALATSPNSVREVRQFLGLCNFFRTHVKNFAQISAPLTTLTRNRCVHSSNLLNAFEQSALSNVPSAQNSFEDYPLNGHSMNRIFK